MSDTIAAEAAEDRRVAMFEIYVRTLTALVQVNAKDDIKMGNTDWTPEHAGELAEAALTIAKAAMLVWEHE